MRKYALVAAIAIALCASLVSEVGAKVIKGTITGAVSSSNITPGACGPVTDDNGTDSYDAMCPPADAASCECLSVSTLKVSGGFGRGTASLTATADESATVETGGVYGTCAPAFGVVTLSIAAKGRISARTQTLNALGAICGTAGVTPVSILGGFTIVGSSSNPQASGSGTFNGTVSPTGQVSITLSGQITNP
jgi:hypothetical protein